MERDRKTTQSRTYGKDGHSLHLNVSQSFFWPPPDAPDFNTSFHHVPLFSFDSTLERETFQFLILFSSPNLTFFISLFLFAVIIKVVLNFPGRVESVILLATLSLSLFISLPPSLFIFYTNILKKEGEPASLSFSLYILSHLEISLWKKRERVRERECSLESYESRSSSFNRPPPLLLLLFLLFVSSRAKVISQDREEKGSLFINFCALLKGLHKEKGSFSGLYPSFIYSFSLHFSVSSLSWSWRAKEGGKGIKGERESETCSPSQTAKSFPELWLSLCFLSSFPSHRKERRENQLFTSCWLLITIMMISLIHHPSSSHSSFLLL